MTERLVSALTYAAVPAAGIIFFGWDWRSIVLLYWLENVTVGVRTLIAMGRTQAAADPAKAMNFTVNGVSRPGLAQSKGFLMVFFTLHYGIFTLVHGGFVAFLVFGPLQLFGFMRGAAPADAVAGVGLGGILLVWGVSSLVQLIMACGEPRSELPPATTLMTSPYGRIIALHVTILGGAFHIMYFGWPPITALLLVSVHALLDLRSLRKR